MSYRVDFSVEAIVHIDEYFSYLRRYSRATAEKYKLALQKSIDEYLVDSPETFAFYWETGAPYRAFLFRVSRRTAYWVIYRVYNNERIVRVLRFRSTANEPGTHDL
jgi:hypothetical protein